jgi:hypothetical protein
MDWRQTAVQAPFRIVGLVLGALYITMLFWAPAEERALAGVGS